MIDYPYEAIVVLGDKDEIVEYTGDEVVRCKDCEYWDDHERCDFWSSLMSPQYPEKNDYCSYGERADA